MTVSADFDEKRVITGGGGLIKPFRVRETESLSDSLKKGDIQADTPVLVVERDADAIVLVTSQMSYYHIAQGECAGRPWGVFF